MKQIQKENYRNLFFGKTHKTSVQLFRYTFVGGLAYVVDFSLLYVFTEFLHIYYLISATISFTVGSVVNYYLSIYWIFPTRSLKKKSMEFIIFITIGVTGLGFNVFFIWLFTEKLRLFYILSKCISAVIVYSWNFFIRKIILFKQI